MTLLSLLNSCVMFDNEKTFFKLFIDVIIGTEMRCMIIFIYFLTLIFLFSLTSELFGCSSGAQIRCATAEDEGVFIDFKHVKIFESYKIKLYSSRILYHKYLH